MRSSFSHTAIASLLSLVAQLSNAQPTEVGIKAGPSLSTWRTASSAFHPLPGLVFGAYAPVPITPRLIFQAEAQLHAGGTLERGIGDDGPALRTLALRLPLTLRVPIIGRVEVAGGTDVAYTFLARNMRSGTSTDITGRVRPIAAGLITGISYRPTRTTDVSVRYIHGLTPLLRDDEQLFPTERVLQFAIGRRLTRLKGGGSGYRSRKLARR